MKITDTRGLQCPAPIIAARKALRETAEGEMFRLLTDSKTSLDNLIRYLKDNMAEFTVKETDGEWILDIRKGMEVKAEAEAKAKVEVKDEVKDEVKTEAETEGDGEDIQEAEMYCNTSVPHFTKGDFVIVFSSDKMGEGDEELGDILMANFIKAIKDLDALPSAMLFYKGGVRLLIPESPVSEFISEIERMGVRILVCSTCVKYFSLDGKIKTGTLSNMYEIAQVMASAGHVVKP